MKWFVCLLPLTLAARPVVIPMPQSLEPHAGSIVFARSQPITLVAVDRDSPSVRAAIEMLSRELPGWKVQVATTMPSTGPAIVFQDAQKQGRRQGREGEAVLDPARYFGQSYLLEARGNKVYIEGASAIGVLYGAATLAQLFESGPK